MVSGEVRYYERAIGDRTTPPPRTFVSGQMFYTPPMREHAMIFDKDTVMVSISSRSRTHEEHESDVVRLAQEDRIVP